GCRLEFLPAQERTFGERRQRSQVIVRQPDLVQPRSLVELPSGLLLPTTYELGPVPRQKMDAAESIPWLAIDRLIRHVRHCDERCHVDLRLPSSAPPHEPAATVVLADEHPQ